MPPSGFVEKETKALMAFAGSLLARFMQEVKDGKHVSVQAGVAHELEVINRVLDIFATTRAERATLLFVKELYLDFRDGKTIATINEELGALSEKHYE